MLIGFDLLDRQILDRDGIAVGNVDDVELAVVEDGTLRISALHVGAQAWGRRLGGPLGRAITATAIRLQRREPPGPLRIPYDLVDKVDSAVWLKVGRDLLAEPELEAWLREHLIARIPGAEGTHA
jgi:sporulation protein YlmC with PRC-barrel domain